ncbi:hypothetical protein ACS0TY_012177 [Phlomoides rotata]
MGEVSLICKRTVTSTKPVEPRKVIPLSVLDRIMENNHLRLVFYYKFQTGRRAGEVTKKLRESISETLSAFPKVIGRLVRTPEGHWTIKCNDAGVRMVEARVASTVEDWLHNVDREKELKLITEFEDGGLAVGLSCASLVSDPICATMVIKAWADMTLRGEISYPPLFLPLPSKKRGEKRAKNEPYVHLIEHYKSVVEQSGSVSVAKHTSISLHFSQEMVMSCVCMANARDHATSVTPFEALTALFWTRISKVKGTKNGLIDMTLCLDMRKVLALEKGFFGNCMVYKSVRADGADVNDVSKAAASIKETVSRIHGDEVMELIEWLERKNCVNPACKHGSYLISVNLENVDSCSSVFEENAGLIRASYYVEPGFGAGRILVLPSPDRDEPYGRVVAVTLPEDEAEKLLEDALIKRLGANILMGLNRKVS